MTRRHPTITITQKPDIPNHDFHSKARRPLPSLPLDGSTAPIIKSHSKAQQQPTITLTQKPGSIQPSLSLKKTTRKSPMATYHHSHSRARQPQLSHSQDGPTAPNHQSHSKARRHPTNTFTRWPDGPNHHSHAKARQHPTITLTRLPEHPMYHSQSESLRLQQSWI